jgi:hypothetical protein
MDLIKALKEKVKPELNHIYTDHPFMTKSGRDAGWFCREHALHLYCLAVLLGKKSKICTGDYILLRPGVDPLQCIGDTSDHAWCRVSGEAPVDVSITVKFLYPDLKDISLIFADQEELASPFRVHYLVNVTDQEFSELMKADELMIAYNEKQALTFNVPELLDEPFQFLHKPPSNMPTFPEIHGRDVFQAITYHCYRMITEGVKPLCTYRNPTDTVKEIMRFNPEARQRISELLI